MLSVPEVSGVANFGSTPARFRNGLVFIPEPVPNDANRSRSGPVRSGRVKERRNATEDPIPNMDWLIGTLHWKQKEESRSFLTQETRAQIERNRSNFGLLQNWCWCPGTSVIIAVCWCPSTGTSSRGSTRAPYPSTGTSLNRFSSVPVVFTCLQAIDAPTTNMSSISR